MSEGIKILLATSNQSKVKRYKNLELTLPVKLLSLQDLDINLNVVENGATELENARIKAVAGYNASKIPSIGLDSGFYVQNLPPDQQPGKDVKRKAGVLETDSPQTSYDKMLAFYINLANQAGKEMGGQADAYFLDAYCLFDGQKYVEATAKRHLVLTNTPRGQDLNFPISSLYMLGGVYYHELNEQQMEGFLKPSNDEIERLISKFLETFKT